MAIPYDSVVKKNTKHEDASSSSQQYRSASFTARRQSSNQLHQQQQRSFSMRDDPPPAFEEVVTTAPQSRNHSRHNSVVSECSDFELPNLPHNTEESQDHDLGIHESNDNTSGWRATLLSWAQWNSPDSVNASSTTRSRAVSDPTTPNNSNSRSQNQQQPIKILGLKIFNARFHFLLGLARVC